MADWQVPGSRWRWSPSGWASRLFTASLAVLMVAGCEDPAALTYHRKLLRAHNQLNAAMLGFTRVVQPALRGQRVDAGEVEQALEAARSQLQAAQQAADAGRPPAGEAGRALSEEFGRTLALHRELITNRLPALGAIAGRESPSQARADALREGLETLQAELEASTATLSDALQAYAAEHDLEVATD